MSLRQIIPTITFSLLIINTFSQQTKVERFLIEQCGEGTILFRDSTSMVGTVCFRLDEAAVALKTNEDYKVYSAKKVIEFKFYDSSRGIHREFYSLPGDDPRNHAPADLFFEVLRNYKKFVLLRVIDPLSMKRNIIKPPRRPDNRQNALRLNQTETICILEEGHELKPYLRITRFAVNRPISEKSRSDREILDHELMKTLLAMRKDDVSKYARKNKLSFTDTDDLIKILDYAEEESKN